MPVFAKPGSTPITLMGIQPHQACKHLALQPEGLYIGLTMTGAKRQDNELELLRRVLAEALTHLDREAEAPRSVADYDSSAMQTVDVVRARLRSALSETSPTPTTPPEAERVA